MKEWMKKVIGNSKNVIVNSHNNTFIMNGQVMSGNTVNGNMHDVSIDEKQSIPAGSISQIEIDSACFDTTIVSSKDEEFHLHFHGQGQSNLTQEDFLSLLQIEATNDTLRVTIKQANISIMNGKFAFELAVPNRSYTSVSYDSTSGDIHISEQHITSLVCTTASGDIFVNRTEGNRIRMKTMSGDITTLNASLGEIDINTMSGDVLFKRAYVHESITVGTMSGDIDLSLTNPKGYRANTSTMSGDVSTKGHSSQNGIKLTAKTMSGDIDIHN